MLSIKDIHKLYNLSSYKLLGDGHFSKVYSLTSDTVIKICRSKEDLSYIWTLHCLHNKDHHLPIIHDLVSLSDGYFAIMKMYYVDTSFSYTEKERIKRKLYKTHIGHIKDYYEINTYKGTKARRLSNHAGTVAPTVDTHSGNWMYDPDKKEIILTDPLAGTIVKKRTKHIFNMSYYPKALHDNPTRTTTSRLSVHLQQTNQSDQVSCF